MGREDYEAYERFGTPSDARGNTIPSGRRRPLPHLTEDEATLYDCVTDPAWDRHRRIEQEKIPLDLARDVLLERMQRLDETGVGEVVAAVPRSVLGRVPL